MIAGLDVNTNNALDDVDLDFEDDTPDPMEDVERSGNVVEDSPKEISATLAAFKAAASNEQQTFEDNTDSEYWFTVVFQNRRQKDAFLEATGWVENHDKYLDGEWLAEELGVELPEANQRYIVEEEEKKIAALPRIRNKPNAPSDQCPENQPNQPSLNQSNRNKTKQNKRKEKGSR